MCGGITFTFSACGSVVVAVISLLSLVSGFGGIWLIKLIFAVLSTSSRPSECWPPPRVPESGPGIFPYRPRGYQFVLWVDFSHSKPPHTLCRFPIFWHLPYCRRACFWMSWVCPVLLSAVCSPESHRIFIWALFCTCSRNLSCFPGVIMSCGWCWECFWAFSFRAKVPGLWGLSLQRSLIWFCVIKFIHLLFNLNLWIHLLYHVQYSFTYLLIKHITKYKI